VRSELPGQAAVLVPTHLTTAGSEPPLTGPTPIPAPALVRTTAPAPSMPATMLAEYVHAFSLPGSETLPKWAPLAAVPWRRLDPQAVARGVEPVVEDFAPGTQDGFTLDLALTERDLRANIAALLDGTYRIPLVNGGDLTVQLVPSRARWLVRGAYSALNFPEHAVEPDREDETHRSRSGNAEFDLGHPVGRPLEKGAENSLLDPGADGDRDGRTVRVTKNSRADYVESNRQRDGDFDYYVFDAEYHITGPHGHRVTVAAVNGLVGMLSTTVLDRLFAHHPGLPLERPPLDVDRLPGEWAREGTLPPDATARIVAYAGGMAAVRAAGLLRLWIPAENLATATTTARRLSADLGVPVQLLIRHPDGSIDRHLVTASPGNVAIDPNAWVVSPYSREWYCVEATVLYR
jgi:hypothetical protein